MINNSKQLIALRKKWLNFKKARYFDEFLSDKDKIFITINDREKMIDELFEYIFGD